MSLNPFNRLSKILSKITVPYWLGPCASVLCLIHCFSLPILIIMVPGLSNYMGSELSHHLDFLFLAISAVVGFKVLDQISAASWIRLVFVVTSLLGLVFLLIERHDLFHVFLVLMAIFQLAATIHKHRNRRMHPPCCESENCETAASES